METVTRHKDLSVGEFVKVVQVDGPVVERLNFSGQVVKVSPEFLEIKTFDGIAGISIENKDEYKIEVSKLKRKPTGWDKYMKNPEKYREKEAEIAPVVNKRVQVYKIVKNNPRKKKDSLVKQAMDEVGGEKAVIIKYVEMGILKFR